MAVTIHPLPPSVQTVRPPAQFTYPFCYEPHPLCIAAVDEVRHYLAQHSEWREELQRGKMFGVLIVSPRGDFREAAFLAAFSGTFDGKTQHPYFVPPVFDLMAPGCYFQKEEGRISSINERIASMQAQIKESPLRQQMQQELQAYRSMMQEEKQKRHRLRAELSPEELTRREPELIRQSQYQKAQYQRLQQEWKRRISADEASSYELREQIERLQKERHQRSIALQQWLFQQFVFLNALGETKTLPELFAPAVPPSGAGECCAPRLLQAAYQEGLKPLCMAEFWVGASPRDEIRHEGHFYPACDSKCRPILRHMLRGLNVEPNPLHADREHLLSNLHIIYKNSEMAVVDKPAGLGRTTSPACKKPCSRCSRKPRGHSSYIVSTWTPAA